MLIKWNAGVSWRIYSERKGRTQRHQSRRSWHCVRDNDRIVIKSSGQIWAGVVLTGNNGPDGWHNIDGDPKFPLKGSHPYCLYGIIGSDEFYIGFGKDYRYNGPGASLQLAINDDVPGNGAGAFHCTVEVWRETSTDELWLCNQSSFVKCKSDRHTNMLAYICYEPCKGSSGYTILVGQLNLSCAIPSRQENSPQGFLT